MSLVLIIKYNQGKGLLPIGPIEEERIDELVLALSHPDAMIRAKQGAKQVGIMRSAVTDWTVRPFDPSDKHNVYDFQDVIMNGQSYFTAE